MSTSPDIATVSNVQPAKPNTAGTIPLLLIAAFVVILNETTMAFALSALMQSFQIDEVTAQWVSTGFLLTMAVVIPISGFLIQRFPTRRVFLTAMGVFTVGTVVCATAFSFPVLVAGRVVQASGTAIMMPLLMTTIMTLVPVARRGQTMGNVAIAMAVAPAIGPTLSGLIIGTLGWRWTFILIIPIAVAAWVIGYLKLQNINTPRVLPIDALSVVLAAVGFGGLVYALSQISAPTPREQVMVAALAGAVGLGLFIARQLQLQTQERPLLDLRTFKIRTFTLAALTMMVLFGAMIGSFSVFPLYLEQVRLVETHMAGLMTLPGGLIMGAMSQIVGRVYDKSGPRPLAIPGTLLVALALFGYSTINATTPIWMLVGMHVSLMVGLGLVFTPMFSAGLGSLPPQLYPHGSALVGTLQQLGGAAGIALFLTLLAGSRAAGTRSGLPEVAASTNAYQLVFTVAGCLALVALALVIFVRRTDASQSH